MPQVLIEELQNFDTKVIIKQNLSKYTPLTDNIQALPYDRIFNKVINKIGKEF